MPQNIKDLPEVVKTLEAHGFKYDPEHSEYSRLENADEEHAIAFILRDGFIERYDFYANGKPEGKFGDTVIRFEIDSLKWHLDLVEHSDPNPFNLSDDMLERIRAKSDWRATDKEGVFTE